MLFCSSLNLNSGPHSTRGRQKGAAVRVQADAALRPQKEDPARWPEPAGPAHPEVGQQNSQS